MLRNILTEEGLEELEYVIETNNELPTYKCPFKVSNCEFRNMNISDRWKNRYECIKCKHKLKNKLK